VDDVYCSPDIIWVSKIMEDEMGGACGMYGEKRNVFKVFMSKPGEDCLGKLGIDGMMLKSVTTWGIVSSSRRTLRHGISAFV
jgi:hypothetical protein